MLQLIRMMANKPKCWKNEISLNFKCPYQARVIKEFERINNPMVYKAFILVN
jgi:hypothetical protein